MLTREENDGWRLCFLDPSKSSANDGGGDGSDDKDDYDGRGGDSHINGGRLTIVEIF